MSGVGWLEDMKRLRIEEAGALTHLWNAPECQWLPVSGNRSLTFKFDPIGSDVGKTFIEK